MVDNLWAMIKLVLPFIRLSIADCICISVLVSIELVASSNINILGSANITLAIVSNCFWPADMLVDSSLINELYPFGNVFIKWWTCAAFAASTTSVSVASSLLYLIFSFTVPPNSQVSCNTIPNILRSSPLSKSFTLWPSTSISPSVTS